MPTSDDAAKAPWPRRFRFGDEWLVVETDPGDAPVALLAGCEFDVQDLDEGQDSEFWDATARTWRRCHPLVESDQT